MNTLLQGILIGAGLLALILITYCLRYKFKKSQEKKELPELPKETVDVEEKVEVEVPPTIEEITENENTKLSETDKEA